MQYMSIFGNKESYIGVDIGAGGIKLVELKKQKGRPQLWTYGIADEALDIHLPEMPDKTVQDLAGTTMLESAQQAAPRQTVDTTDPRIDKYAAMLRAVAKA